MEFWHMSERAGEEGAGLSYMGWLALLFTA